MTHGLLLINLGTPSLPNKTAIRTFLREFLVDQRVLNLPIWLRYLIVYTLILPFRPKRLVKAYQSIWGSQGSPLFVNSLNLEQSLRIELGAGYIVALGMRYGRPSLYNALKLLESCHTLTILPLYPQYSAAATGSAIDYVFSLLRKWPTYPNIHLIRDFYQHPGFITSQSELIKLYIDQHEHIVFSFHGVPIRQLRVVCPKICTASCTDSGYNHCSKA